jgi:protein SCO1/2
MSDAQTRHIALAAAGAIVLLVGASALAVWRPWAPADRYAACRTARVAGTAAIGGPFTLTDQTGATVTEADVITGPTLVYFGYTYCPDVCPVDSSRNAEAVDLLAERGLDVRPVFITIDPARDTPDVVADWTGFMHERMIGLTGTPEQIAAAARAYGAYYAPRGTGDDYLMDHSSFTYLMVPGEGFLEIFRSDIGAAAMADRVACFLAAA